MENENNGEGIVDNAEEINNEEGAEFTEETPAEEEAPKTGKPKRTPQEELEYFEGRAARLRKKLGAEETSKPKEKPSEKPNDLDYGQLALLRTEGIKGSEEVALFKEIMSETGKGVLDVLDSKYFNSRLTELRESRASAAAIPKGKMRGGQTAVTDVDIAVSNYKETGKLPSDFSTRNKVIDIITKEETGELFSGPSVIK